MNADAEIVMHTVANLLSHPPIMLYLVYIFINMDADLELIIYTFANLVSHPPLRYREYMYMLTLYMYMLTFDADVEITIWQMIISTRLANVSYSHTHPWYFA